MCHATLPGGSHTTTSSLIVYLIMDVPRSTMIVIIIVHENYLLPATSLNQYNYSWQCLNREYLAT